MKRLLFFAPLFVFFAGLLMGFPQILFAQTSDASLSAITTPLPALPTLFPTVTPTPTTVTAFPLLDQINELATSSVSNSATASTSATTATDSAVMTPDDVASGSAQDYCLNVPIFMYHHVEDMNIATQLGHPQLTEDYNYFDEHIKYLVDHHYHLLSLEALVHAILNHGTVPPKSVVITVDDGYIDAYTYAFLVAKKYHAIVNFMIPTGLIGQSDYMLWDHLKEMAASPYAQIYNHTTTHAALGLIDQDQIIQEVTTANQDLKKNLGINNDIVVYPYGSYNDLAIQTVKQLGMIAAVSTDPGTNDCISNIYKLPRVRVGNEPIEYYGY
jgi:peptidoglycan/xylan/chitin deacetylase (PgdA/CDA1 family)